MRRPSWLSKLWMLGTSLWLVLGCGVQLARAQVRPLLPPRIPHGPADLADPLPIRRVLVPLERVSGELARAGAGKLVHLTQEEFESRVRAARVAQEGASERPRLVSAHYRAALIDSALTGSADWSITHAGLFPGVFPLRPFSLALRQATLDGAPAILGEVDAPALGLLVEGAGTHRLHLDWSARGEAGPNELRFDLRIPSCVVTKFDLDLPAGRQLSARGEQCLVSGPFPGAAPGRERWTLEILNRVRVELIVRSPGREDRGAPLVVARVEERQNLSIDQVECIHDFTLDVNRGAVRELDFLLSPNLQPLSLTYRNRELENWVLLAPVPGQSERRLKVHLPEALAPGSTVLRVRAIAPALLDQEWRSPDMRLQNVMLVSESLTLQAAPEIELTDWHSGHFDLLKTLTDASGSWNLQLQAGPLASNKPPAENVGRPRARPRLQSAQTTATVQMWWNIEPGAERLLARARLVPRGGPLFRVQCRIPAGWRIERAELQPSGTLVDSMVLESNKTNSLVLLHLNEAIEPLQAVTILLNLTRPAPPSAGGEVRYAIPALELLKMQSQDCWLGVSVASQFRVKATPAAIYWKFPFQRPAFKPGPEPASSEKPLWGEHALWGLTRFHRSPPAGEFVLMGSTPRLRLHAVSRIDLSMDQPRAGLRLTVEPVAGTLASADVQFTGPVPASWQWTTTDGRPARVQPVPPWETLRIPGLAANPLNLAGVLVDLLDKQNVLRFTFPDGAATRQVFETGPVGQLNPRQWEVPLPVRVGAVPIAGEVDLVGFRGGRVHFNAPGLTVLPLPEGPGNPADQRRFTYEGGAPSLVLHGPDANVTPFDKVRVDNITLLTAIDHSGHIRERLTFDLHQAGGSFLPLSLPVEDTVVSVQVDGRWVEDLRTQEEGDYRILKIPAPGGKADSVIEVTSEREVGPLRTLERVSSRLPRFPVPATSLKRVWSLAPGLVPTNWQNLDLLPGSSPPAFAWNLDSWVAGRTASRQARAQMQHLVAEADVSIRTLANDAQSAPLGERLQILIKELNKGQLGLVVDAQALRVAGLTVQSVPLESKQPESLAVGRGELELLAPYLESFGLELLATHPVPLLTTQRARASRGWEKSSLRLEQALLEAARQGRDATGRFVNAIVWLEASDCETGPALLPGAKANPFPNWPCWQVRSTTADMDSLPIVRQSALNLVGGLLLIALGSLTWLIRKRRRVLVVLGGVVGVGLVLIWIFVPLHLCTPLLGPSLLGLLVGLGMLIVQRSTNRSLAMPVLQVPLAGLLIALLAALPGLAAAPVDFVVLLLSEDGGKRIGVLAPTELLDSLTALVERSKQPLEHPLLLTASYRGKSRDGAAEFEAEFDVFCPVKGPADFLLPLGNTELLSATCDQKPAFPLAAPGTQPGYLFRLEGVGRHRLLLRFTVGMIGTGTDRECRFSIPDVAISQLEFLAPLNSLRLQAVGARGQQQQTNGVDGIRLLADLGRITQLQLRWGVAEGKDDRPLLEVKELYLWDLQTARRLMGVFRYQVVRGSESALQIDIPAEWEVRRVETASLAGGATNRLRDWVIAPAAQGQRLRLEFQAPLVAGVQVFLELLNRTPATTQASLALPTPLGAASSGGLLAYHLGRREAVLTESLGFTGIDIKSFITPWQSAGVEDPGTVGRAFSFRRSTGQALSMHLDLRALSGYTAQQELVWRAGLRELVCDAVLQLAGREENLVLAEWDLPAGLQLEEILGPDVHSWSITDRRVQVWLRPGLTKATLSWRAWIPVDSLAGQLLSLPFPRLVHATKVETKVQIEPEPGCSLSGAVVKNLRVLPAATGKLAFSADRADLACDFRVLQLPTPPVQPVAEEPALVPRPAEANQDQAVYLVLAEQLAILEPDNTWLYRADYDLLAGAGQILVEMPPNSTLQSACLDGQALQLSDRQRLDLSFDAQLRLRRLRIAWRRESGQDAVHRPSLRGPKLQKAAPLPGAGFDDSLWKLVVPMGLRPTTHDLFATRTNLADLYLRRAAADLALAGHSSLTALNLARTAEVRFQRNTFAASAWLAQAPLLQQLPGADSALEQTLEKLESENRQLLLDVQGPDKGLTPETKSRRPALDASRQRNPACSTGLDCSAEQGLVSFWLVRDGDEDPLLRLSPENTQAAGRWRGSVLSLLLIGALLMLLVPWISDSRRTFWQPELGMGWSILAGILLESWILALLLLAVCLVWRVARAVASWRAANLVEPAVPAATPQSV